jgi:hypothetical protein
MGIIFLVNIKHLFSRLDADTTAEAAKNNATVIVQPRRMAEGNFKC